MRSTAKRDCIAVCCLLVCLSVCLSLVEHISKTILSIFMDVTGGHDLSFSDGVAIRYVRALPVLDDVKFSHKLNDQVNDRREWSVCSK